MGNTPSIFCEICNQYWGSLPVLNISQYGNLDGHNICIHCYHNFDESVFKNPKKNTKSRTCIICNCKSKTTQKDQRTPIKPIFKIYWYGKLGNTDMCETCLFDRKYKK